MGQCLANSWSYRTRLRLNPPLAMGLPAASGLLRVDGRQFAFSDRSQGAGQTAPSLALPKAKVILRSRPRIKRTGESINIAHRTQPGLSWSSMRLLLGVRRARRVLRFPHRFRFPYFQFLLTPLSSPKRINPGLLIGFLNEVTPALVLI